MKQGITRARTPSLAMFGTVVGAGTFALPSAFHAMGILAGSIAFWVAALVVLATHLLYAEVVLKNAATASHRLPAQAGIVLGPWARRSAYITLPMQIVGATLAYVILGGEFLSRLAQTVGFPVSVLFWQMVFWVGGAITVFIGLRFVAAVERKTAWVLIGLLVISCGFFFSRADGSLFLTSNPAAASTAIGVFLFALFGWVAIPEIVALAGRDREVTFRAVAFGSLAAAFVMWAFGILSYAAIGNALGTDPSQLADAFPHAWAWILPAVGFLAVTNPFLLLTQDLKAMLHLDAHLPKVAAWSFAVGAPLVLFFATTRDFLSIVSFFGGVVSGLNGTLICLMAFVAFRNARGSVWLWRVAVPVACMAFFVFILVRRALVFVGY